MPKVVLFIAVGNRPGHSKPFLSPASRCMSFSARFRRRATNAFIIVMLNCSTVASDTQVKYGT